MDDLAKTFNAAEIYRYFFKQLLDDPQEPFPFIFK